MGDQACSSINKNDYVTRDRILPHLMAGVPPPFTPHPTTLGWYLLLPDGTQKSRGPHTLAQPDDKGEGLGGT